MGKQVIIVSYMEDRLNEDIINFHKYTNITQEQKSELDQKEKKYLDNKDDVNKNAFLLYR